MEEPSETQRGEDACPGHTKPGSGPAKPISFSQSAKSHLGPRLQPPEGELSVSGELFSSSLPRPPHGRVTWPREGAEPAGASPLGGCAGSPGSCTLWVVAGEVHMFRCMHVLTLACSDSLSQSLSGSCTFSAVPPEAGQLLGLCPQTGGSQTETSKVRNGREPWR